MAERGRRCRRKRLSARTAPRINPPASPMVNLPDSPMDSPPDKALEAHIETLKAQLAEEKARAEKQADDLVAYDTAYAAGLAAARAKAERLIAEFAARNAQQAAELGVERARTEKANRRLRGPGGSARRPGVSAVAPVVAAARRIGAAVMPTLTPRTTPVRESDSALVRVLEASIEILRAENEILKRRLAAAETWAAQETAKTDGAIAELSALTRIRASAAVLGDGGSRDIRGSGEGSASANPKHVSDLRTRLGYVR
jgi:hypothetical protein